jgi:hypothetical protein
MAKLTPLMRDQVLFTENEILTKKIPPERQLTEATYPDVIKFYRDSGWKAQMVTCLIDMLRKNPMPSSGIVGGGAPSSLSSLPAASPGLTPVTSTALVPSSSSSSSGSMPPPPSRQPQQKRTHEDMKRGGEKKYPKKKVVELVGIENIIEAVMKVVEPTDAEQDFNVPRHEISKRSDEGIARLKARQSAASSEWIKAHAEAIRALDDLERRSVILRHTHWEVEHYELQLEAQKDRKKKHVNGSNYRKRRSIASQKSLLVDPT